LNCVWLRYLWINGQYHKLHVLHYMLAENLCIIHCYGMISWYHKHNIVKLMLRNVQGIWLWFWVALIKKNTSIRFLKNTVNLNIWKYLYGARTCLMENSKIKITWAWTNLNLKIKYRVMEKHCKIQWYLKVNKQLFYNFRIWRTSLLILLIVLTFKIFNNIKWWIYLTKAFYQIIWYSPASKIITCKCFSKTLKIINFKWEKPKTSHLMETWCQTSRRWHP
jgi:hypothetical protein